MNKQEALDQIAELKKFVEDLDKPKRVRVYIKEDAKRLTDVMWGGMEMGKMTGRVFDVNCLSGAGIYINREHSSGTWLFTENTFIVVEGSLDDLK